MNEWGNVGVDPVGRGGRRRSSVGGGGSSGAGGGSSAGGGGSTIVAPGSPVVGGDGSPVVAGEVVAGEGAPVVVGEAPGGAGGAGGTVSAGGALAEAGDDAGPGARAAVPATRGRAHPGVLSARAGTGAGVASAEVSGGASSTVVARSGRVVSGAGRVGPTDPDPRGPVTTVSDDADDATLSEDAGPSPSTPTVVTIASANPMATTTTARDGTRTSAHHRGGGWGRSGSPENGPGLGRSASMRSSASPPPSDEPLFRLSCRLAQTAGQAGNFPVQATPHSGHVHLAASACMRHSHPGSIWAPNS